ncbi:AmmeMemoRadiSam system radical SAM enzyme [Candidatus Woesearchaeota archaeon]|nr:AmmeMemoRadiSam system radical SAM enzyme [Candidatus Woesearchaeota archaeon]
MHAAQFYEPLPGKPETVRCTLCPKFCVIPDGTVGFCGVRRNDGGTLVSLVYARPCSISIDPIEKKPLFHFLPGARTLSIGTVGCNLGCLYCQNAGIARAKPGEVQDYEAHPETVVELARQKGCEAIAYTYNEPTVFYEYVLDCARLARNAGLKNIIVTNGFINPAPLAKLLPLIDAANVDLKGFDPAFYRKVCAGELKPVLATIEAVARSDTWLEVTNLLIPGKNDSPEQLRQLVDWLADRAGRDVPLHLSRFFPHYRMAAVPPTPKGTLLEARRIAQERLDHVYLGNIALAGGEDTVCPSCGETLIVRSGFGVIKNGLQDGACPRCGTRIRGMWA